MKDSSSDCGNLDLEKIMIAFASIANSGLILSIGESSLGCCASILKGMDAMSRMVVNLPPNSPENDLETELENDLRVAVHRQSAEEFLNDISHHSFDLVVLGLEEISPTIVGQLASMVMDGGVVIVPKYNGMTDDGNPLLFAGFHHADLGACMLFVRKPFKQEGVRRGGRRARLSGS